MRVKLRPKQTEHSYPTGGIAEELAAGFQLAIQKLTTPEAPKSNWGHLKDSPQAWARQRLGVELWSKQVEVAQSVVDNRYTAVPSCHETGKSFGAGILSCWWIDTHDPGEAFVVTTAPTDPQVKAILWREIRRAHRKGNLPGRITLDAHWYLTEIGDELVGLGRKPNDYEPDAFQGLHQRYILVILDEANGVAKAMWDAVDSLAANANARVLAIGNPDTPGSQFDTVCKPNSGWHVIRIPASSTPNFTGEPVTQAVSENLISPVWVKERAERWGVKSPLYQSKVDANFPDQSDDTLIQPSWVFRAHQRHIIPKAHGQAGFDIARFGVDQSIGYRNRNGNIEQCLQLGQISTTKTTNQIRRLSRDWQGEVTVVIDEVGVGGGVVDQLVEEQYPISPFNGGSRAFDPEKFVNQRAEAYWYLRRLFERDRLDIPEDDEDLAAQLTSIKWFVTRQGKIGIESKEDYMKRMRTGSPDHADALMMTCAPYREIQTLAPESHYDKDGLGFGQNIELVVW